MATVAALVAVGTFRTAASLAIGLGGLGFVLLGLLTGRRRRIDYGAGGLLLAVVLSALFGAPVEATVVATLATFFAGDVGRYGITLGRQLGRTADTVRLEVLHLARSLVVGGTGATVAYSAYRVAQRGEPVGGLVLLLFGCVAIVAGLHDGAS